MDNNLISLSEINKIKKLIYLGFGIIHFSKSCTNKYLIKCFFEDYFEIINYLIPVSQNKNYKDIFQESMELFYYYHPGESTMLRNYENNLLFPSLEAAGSLRNYFLEKFNINENTNLFPITREQTDIGENELINKFSKLNILSHTSEENIETIINKLDSRVIEKLISNDIEKPGSLTNE